MSLLISDITLTEEEYLAYELTSEERHEYINGKLITMPGESDIDNEIAANILILLRRLLKSQDYSVYMEGVKVKIPKEPTYYYPDVFATKETTGNTKQYIKYQPEIIFEVLSDTTRKYDLVDKFIAYQSIPSLVYYVVVEPQKTLVQLFYKENNNWEVISFTNKTDVLHLPALQMQYSLTDIYESE